MSRARKINRQTRNNTVTIEAAAASFFRKNKLKGLSEATQRQYQVYVNQLIDFWGSDNPIEELDIFVIDDFTEMKLNEGCKMITVASTLRHIRRFVNFCAERKLLENFKVEIPKVEETIKEAYSREEIAALLVKPSNNDWVEWRTYTMVKFCLGTGFRLSTILNIKVEDINFIDRQVFLRHNKDKRQKFMPLSRATAEALDTFIRMSGSAPDDYLFPTESNTQLKARSAEQAIEVYNKKRGVSHTGIHRFRHTFAREYIMNGGNPVKLMKLLNHKDITITMKYVNLYSQDYAYDLELYNPLDMAL